MRIMTPRDFERIKKLKAMLAEKGIKSTDFTTLASLISGKSKDSDAIDNYQHKKRRRGARNLGLAEDEVPDVPSDSDSDDAGGFGSAGVRFAPAVRRIDPSALESDLAKKKRRAAVRLVDVVEAKKEKYAGKQGGGGLTDREKQRFKNFNMVRKSASVQAKMRASLQSSRGSLRKQIKNNSVMDKRKKQRRRRT
jgi:hypothetical protein